MPLSWINEFDVFLFDLDGLLVNTEELHFEAYKKILAVRNYLLDWDFIAFCSTAHQSTNSLREAIYAYFPKLQIEEPNWEVIYREKQAVYINLLKYSKLKLLPGVHRVIEEIIMKKGVMCVVTNSSKEETDLIRANVPALNTIPYWITRELYLKPKPAPDAYLAALKIFSNESQTKIVGFEDSIRGIRALKASKLNHVWICSEGYFEQNHRELERTLRFASFSQIPDTIDLLELMTLLEK